MKETIQQLKNEKQQLELEYKNHRVMYQTRRKQLDTAIRKTEEAVAALSGDEPAVKQRRRWQGLPDAIERILGEGGAMHLQDIFAELERRGFRTSVGTVHGICERYKQMGKRFRRVAPATYAVLGGEAVTAAVQIH